MCPNVTCAVAPSVTPGSRCTVGYARQPLRGRLHPAVARARSAAGGRRHRDVERCVAEPVAAAEVRARVDHARSSLGHARL